MEVTTAEIRTLVDRPAGDVPVTSLYVDTDGSRYPRAADYEARVEALLRDLRKAAESMPDARAQAVRADAEAIMRWVRDEFERDGVRGLAVFSCGGEVFESVQVGESFRDVARVNDTPYVVPLEAALGRSYHIGLVLIERDRAKVFRYRLGRLEQYLGLTSDVHGQHRQGGWSSLRFQKNIEHEVLHHYKDTVDVLMDLHEHESLDVLVIAGPDAEAAEFERQLHPYLQKIVHGERLNIGHFETPDEVKQHLGLIEQQLVSARRADLLGRLAAAQGQAEKAARGVRHVLEAVNAKSIEVLFAVEGAGIPGYRSASGALALRQTEAVAYGEPVTPVPDLVDVIIEEAVRMGAHIELFRDEVRLDGDPVAALLRF